MSKRVKAYQASDGNDQCDVFFESSCAAARRRAGNEFGCDWEGIDYCRRAPEFDQYAPGPVPPLVMIEAGWWFECVGCGRRIDSDMADEYFFDHEGNDLPPEDIEPIVHKANVYCCHACLARDQASRAMSEARKAAICELVLVRYPEATVMHVYGGTDSDAGWDFSGWEATFNLPGIKHGVQWKAEDRDHVWVAQSEKDEFLRLYPSTDSHHPQQGV